jgi:hypothetical protein
MSSAQAGGQVVIVSKPQRTTPNVDSRESAEPAASVDVNRCGTKI